LEVSSFVTAENLNDLFANFSETPILNIHTIGTKSVYGFKFTRSAVSFDSLQPPVWGDFLARDATGTNPTTGATNVVIRAWNTGVGTDPEAGATNFTNWIPTPDSVVVPLPGSIVLFGSALAGLVWLRQRL
jgi:hypothetical protein